MTYKDGRGIAFPELDLAEEYLTCLATNILVKANYPVVKWENLIITYSLA